MTHLQEIFDGAGSGGTENRKGEGKISYDGLKSENTELPSVPSSAFCSFHKLQPCGTLFDLLATATSVPSDCVSGTPTSTPALGSRRTTGTAPCHFKSNTSQTQHMPLKNDETFPTLSQATSQKFRFKMS